MKSLKISVAFIFLLGTIAALAAETFGYPPLLAKAKKFGAKDCTFCHVDPDGGPPWNERGQWLIKEKERRGAQTVDVEWLADYKADQKPAPAKSDDNKPAAEAKTGKPDPKTYDDFVGEYELPPGTLIVTHEGDKLYGQPRGDFKEELRPQDDGTFAATNVEAKVRFVRDDKGKVVGVVITLGDQEMKGTKVK